MTNKEYELVMKVLGLIGGDYEAYHFDQCVKTDIDFHGIPVHQIKVDPPSPVKTPEGFETWEAEDWILPEEMKWEIAEISDLGELEKRLTEEARGFKVRIIGLRAYMEEIKNGIIQRT